MSAGTNEGVMKLVGKAIRDYSVCGEGDPIPCISIAPWGKIIKRDTLKRTNDV